MPKFTFKAVDGSNRTVCGDLQAPTPALAELRLRQTYTRVLGLWNEEGQSLLRPRAAQRVALVFLGLLLVIGVWLWTRM